MGPESFTDVGVKWMFVTLSWWQFVDVSDRIFFWWHFMCDIFGDIILNDRGCWWQNDENRHQYLKIVANTFRL